MTIDPNYIHASSWNWRIEELLKQILSSQGGAASGQGQALTLERLISLDVQMSTTLIQRLDQLVSGQNAAAGSNEALVDLLQEQMDTITALQGQIAALQTQVSTLQAATDGTSLPTAYDQTAKPGSPQNGELWLQRSSTGYPLELWQWDSTANKWLSYANHQAHLRINGGIPNNGAWILLGGSGTTSGQGDAQSTNLNFLRGDGVLVSNARGVFAGSGTFDASNYIEFGWTVRSSGLTTDNTFTFMNTADYVSNADWTLRPVITGATGFNQSFTLAQLFNGDFANGAAYPGFRIASRAIGATSAGLAGLLAYIDYKSYLNPA